MNPLSLCAVVTNRELHKIYPYDLKKEKKDNIDNRHVTFAKKRYPRTNNDIVKQ